jgi:hypothetical protein
MYEKVKGELKLLPLGIEGSTDVDNTLKAIQRVSNAIGRQIRRTDSHIRTIDGMFNSGQGVFDTFETHAFAFLACMSGATNGDLDKLGY